ncbi:Fatty acyl-CoA reductase 1 [Blattella germanica]|nr:Fatty acyl-CoA reductase 1 [Blattella germanica]
METIQEFYDNQDVFITGGSGFMGKVLIEKLLRSCRGINKLYILMRSKKGKDIEQRLADIINMPLFDVVKKECPERLAKIVPVSGDVMKLGLGLSESDKKTLEENVSIVFHSAASVRFDDSLTKAIIMNTRGTREMMLIARNMKKLKVLVHVSTSFSNCDREEVEEKLYPPHADWRKIIDIVETIDEHSVNILTPKILRNLPNTYIFSKSLAEHVVKDLGENMPLVIFRPSIVISTLKEPFPGWLDNFNGPVSLLVGGGKGVVRAIYADPQAIVDFMPVDVAIKVTILAAWHRSKLGTLVEPMVFNGTCGTKRRVSLQRLVDMGLEISTANPFENMIWIEYGHISLNKYRFYWRMAYTQLLPALFIDAIIKLTGNQPLLLRLHRRIFSAQMALHFFVKNTWLFRNENMFKLRDTIEGNDRIEFDIDGIEYSDDIEYFRTAMYGARTYLMKENPATIPDSRRHRTR